MYFESSVAINVSFATLYFSFGRLLSPVCQVPVMCGQPTTSSAPQWSSSSSPSSCSFQAVLASSSVCSQPQCQTLQAEPAEGCPRPLGAACGRMRRPSVPCATKAVFTRARPQKQPAVCKGRVQNTLSSLCSSGFVQHIPACR